MAKRKKRSGIGVAFFSIIILVGAIYVGYYFLEKQYGDKIQENTTTTEPTTKSVISDDSPYVTLEDGDYKGMTIYKVYKDVFEGKQNVVVGANEYKINEYLNSTNTEINDIGEVKAVKYASVDMDADGTDEIIIKLEKDEECVYAVLHYSESVVYGYSYINNRCLLNLKTDGTFIGSSGALNSQVLKMSFVTTKITQTELASVDGEKFKVEGNEVTQEEYDKYMKTQSNKTDVTFIDMN